MNTEKLLKRKTELFAPIEQQILMTDEPNDLLLLASNMCESSCRIFLNHFTEEETKSLIKELLRITINEKRGDF